MSCASVADHVAYSRLCSVMSKEGPPLWLKCYPIPAARSVTATCDVLLCKVGFGHGNKLRYYTAAVQYITGGQGVHYLHCSLLAYRCCCLAQ
jgi:hypothetical protein